MRAWWLPGMVVAMLSTGASGEPPAAREFPSFQALVNAAEPDTTLTPPAGVYAGPVLIDKPLTIDGREGVTIDAGGVGSVVILDTDGATLRNLHLTNSGNSHNDIDAGVQVRGNFNYIVDNRIDDSLFGVDLQQSEFNVVRGNHISSKDVDLGIRGDAIRLWYSFDNRIEENTIEHSRDLVVWYSRDNVIRRNRSSGGRYSLHFMYSQYNLVEENDFRGNSVGIFLMYSDSVTVRGNHISHAVGAAGVGIGFKETSDVEIVDNEILYSAIGLHLDVSPFQPDTTNRIYGNLIAYNGIGIQFLNDWQGMTSRTTCSRAT
jgi:nitrous oxidase accessory protein